MHVQHQKGIPATIAIYPIDDHETYTLKKKEKKKIKIKNWAISPFFGYCH